MNSRVKSLRWMFLLFLIMVGQADLVGAASPETLDEAVEIARSMRASGATRREIAQWVVDVVDERIVNCNDPWEFCGYTGLARLHAWRKMQEAVDNVTIARWAWTYRLGNCNENGNTVYYILREAFGRGDGGLRLVNSKDYHSFVVWGLDDQAVLDDPDTWGSEAFAADSWLGEVVEPEGVKTRKWFKSNGKRPIVDITDAADPEPAEWERRQKERERQKRKTKEVEPCFVATAVYGTPMATEVQILREFRDRELRKTHIGRIIIRIYEEIGPGLAIWLDQNEEYKKPVRQYVIEPVLNSLKSRQQHKEPGK